MKTLRVRLTLWFALSFFAVTGVFLGLTYRHLDVELRRRTFQREVNINPNWILHGSFSEEEIRDIMAQLAVASLIYSLPMVLVTLVIGYFISRKSLKPIGSLNHQLLMVGPRNLHCRVRLPEADAPLQDLVAHLNDMLARLERSFADVREYSARVAHELRTPLTILRLKLEQSQAELEPGLADELDAELHRLTHVVDQTLLIAKAEQGRLTWQQESFDLGAVLADLVRDFRLLAAEEGRNVEYVQSEGCQIRCDSRYCRQILHTLLTNSLMHGSGKIKIRVLNRRGFVRLIILNPVRPHPRSEDQTLGLGLRVVRALLGHQVDARFRQRHGSQYHATSLAFPCAAPESRPSVEVATRQWTQAQRRKEVEPGLEFSEVSI